MLPIIRKLKIILKAFYYAGLAWLLLLLIGFWQFTESVDALLEMNDRFFYKRFFRLRATFGDFLGAFEDLVIIDSVDPKEARRRDDYAEIIRMLAGSEAACIGIDIRFIGNREQAGDSALVEAVRQFPRTVVAMSFETGDTLSPYARVRIRDFALPATTAKKFLRKLKSTEVALPFDSLLSAIDNIGHLNFQRELYHIFPVVFEYDLHSYPALPFEIARVYREYKGQSLNITEIPTTTHAQVFVNFVPYDRFEHMTLEEARARLESQPLHFQDKIVLLVNSGPEVPFIDTPLGYDPYPRWAMHASMISQLLQNRPIRTSWIPPLLFVAVALLLVLAWNLFIAERLSERWRRIRWMLLIGDAAFVLLAYLGLQFEHWFGVVTPVIIYTIGLVAIRNDTYRIYQIPEYEDFSVSVTEYQGDGYPVSIMHSPVGEEVEKISFPEFFMETSFVGIEEKLRQLAAGLKDTRELGRQLYQAIFQKSIEMRFLQSLGIVNKDSKNLRIRLRLDAPEVSRLPWEYLYSEELPNGFVGLNSNISLTRYIPFATPREPAAYRPPLRILVAIASPTDLSPLDVDAEKRSIRKCLGILIWLRQVRLTFCEHATLEKLANAVSSGNHHVLHYIGHSVFDEAKGEGALALEDENAVSHTVEAATIGGILSESSIRMAVLNSCEGAVAPRTNAFFGMAQTLVKVGVPAVVAMQHMVRDDIAIKFSRTFYSSFLIHFSVDAAVTETRRAIMRGIGLNRQDWGTPVLFMRADGAKVFGLK